MLPSTRLEHSILPPPEDVAVRGTLEADRSPHLTNKSVSNLSFPVSRTVAQYISPRHKLVYNTFYSFTHTLSQVPNTEIEETEMEMDTEIKI